MSRFFKSFAPFVWYVKTCINSHVKDSMFYETEIGLVIMVSDHAQTIMYLSILQPITISN